MLHLVRDPRAVAYSWERRPPDGVGFAPATSSARWVQNNAIIELMRRRDPATSWTRLRYEDFVAEPERRLAELCRWLGIDHRQLPFVAPRTVLLSVNHTVGGNPSRSRHG